VSVSVLSCSNVRSQSSQVVTESVGRKYRDRRHIFKQYLVPSSHHDCLFWLVSWPLPQVGPMSWTSYILATDVHNPDMSLCSLSPANSLKCFLIPKVDTTAANPVIPSDHLTTASVQVCYTTRESFQVNSLLASLLPDPPCSIVQPFSPAKVHTFSNLQLTFQVCLVHLPGSQHLTFILLSIPLTDHYHHHSSLDLHITDNTAHQFLKESTSLSDVNKLHYYLTNASSLEHSTPQWLIHGQQQPSVMSPLLPFKQAFRLAAKCDFRKFSAPNPR
jgi:hypothetical protein